MHWLAFEVKYPLPASAHGITIPVELAHGKQAVSLHAKLDTGADWSIFERGYAERLGIIVEAGDRLELRTVNSRFTAYAHDVTIGVFGWTFAFRVHFHADSNIHRSVLGREDWIVKMRLGLVYHDSHLYLSRYDD